MRSLNSVKKEYLTVSSKRNLLNQTIIIKNLRTKDCPHYKLLMLKNRQAKMRNLQLNHWNPKIRKNI